MLDAGEETLPATEPIALDATPAPPAPLAAKSNCARLAERPIGAPFAFRVSAGATKSAGSLSTSEEASARRFGSFAARRSAMACARLPRAVLVSRSRWITAEGELTATASMIFTTLRRMGTWSALASAPPSRWTHICSACSKPFSTSVICVCGLVVSATASKSRPRSR